MRAIHHLAALAPLALTAIAAADGASAGGGIFGQQVVTGLSNGMIIALIAIGYTMVYGIIELINFAHGDLFMLGAFFSLQLAIWAGAANLKGEATGGGAAAAIALMLGLAPIVCAALNGAVDRAVYK
ncbi:MAG: ABC transporter permease subunit, partial [Planctomycetota bacterium]